MSKPTKRECDAAQRNWQRLARKLGDACEQLGKAHGPARVSAARRKVAAAKRAYEAAARKYSEVSARCDG